MEDMLRQCIRKALNLTPLLRSTLIRPQEVSPVADLPSTQLQALFVLNVTPPLSMSVLARKLAISKQQLTKIADALVARGCVSRSSDEKNRRVILLSLPEEGRALVRALQDEVVERMLPQFGRLDESELQEFSQAADTIRRLLDKVKN